MLVDAATLAINLLTASCSAADALVNMLTHNVPTAMRTTTTALCSSSTQVLGAVSVVLVSSIA